MRASLKKSFITGILSLTLGCAITATRPVQEMSDTSAALRAAKQVQADTLAPELYRLALENFFKAKNSYKFKEFKEAKEYAAKAQNFAEKAEFQAIRSGGNRNRVDATGFEETPAEPAGPQPTPEATKTPPQ